jgi:hypothetical protein
MIPRFNPIIAACVSVVGAQFGEDVLDSSLDGLLGDRELIGDLLIGISGCDQTENVDLCRRQGIMPSTKTRLEHCGWEPLLDCTVVAAKQHLPALAFFVTTLTELVALQAVEYVIVSENLVVRIEPGYPRFDDKTHTFVNLRADSRDPHKLSGGGIPLPVERENHDVACVARIHEKLRGVGGHREWT